MTKDELAKKQASEITFREHASLALTQALMPTIFNQEMANALNDYAKESGTNSGMELVRLAVNMADYLIAELAKEKTI